MKNDIYMFIVIMLAVFVAFMIGLLFGRNVPAEEKYKIYNDNHTTYVERI